MNNNESDQFALGKVMVNPSRNELEADGKTLSLQPKVMEVLHYLALNYERVVSKEELVENLWPGRVVTHGSVQKSINLLRKALAVFLGETEVVAHYSKKGYQLQIEPKFLPASQTLRQGGQRPEDKGPVFSRIGARGLAGLILLAVSVSGIAYLGWNWDRLFIDKSHRLQFQQVSAYTSETDHEGLGEPHPDNQHLAYVRQFDPQGSSNIAESQLVVRNAKGQDWNFAGSKGQWVELAWSPSGDSLLAIEQIRDEAQSLTPDFSSRAPSLYDIHVFFLDLNSRQVLEKHRLSQWQGGISSGTWWNENTFELVARQGESAVNQRYRYTLQAQHLEIVESPEFVTHPLLTRVHRDRTAMASLHNGRLRIDFLASDQRRMASRQLEHRSADLSWIPDGSGVLVHSKEDQALSIVYRNGDLQKVDLPRKRSAETSRYRFSADGQRIFFGESRPKADIWRQASAHSMERAVGNDYWNYSASFSPAGDKIVYVSVRNNQTQIWLLDKGGERQITPEPVSGRVESLNWTSEGENLIYKSGAKVHLYNLERDQSSVLLERAADLKPLALGSEADQLLALKQTGDVDNLWRIDLASGEERQLTFGSVGSALEHRGDIYFNYAGQTGLWVLRKSSGQIEQVARQAEKYSKLLAATESHIFYVTGGECRESDVFRMALDSGQKTVYLPRSNKRISTSSFHPNEGALYSHCDLPEADILVLE